MNAQRGCEQLTPDTYRFKHKHIHTWAISAQSKALIPFNCNKIKWKKKGKKWQEGPDVVQF